MLMLRVSHFVALAGLLLAPPPAQGTILVSLTTQQLTDQADLVIQGSVLEQRIVTLEGRLWTDTSMRVTEALKGAASPGQILIIRQPGGETPTLGMRVAGAAQFQPGERALVFLQRVGDHFIPVGMTQGKYQIYRTAQGALRVRREAAGATLAHFDSAGSVRFEHTLQENDLQLERLLSTIRGRGARGGAR
jgi:hypothetical protein